MEPLQLWTLGFTVFKSQHKTVNSRVHCFLMEPLKLWTLGFTVFKSQHKTVNSRVQIFWTLEITGDPWYAPSLHASRAVTWLTVYRALQVTLRAFLALRVIAMHRKSCREEVVKKIESSQTKSKISQNLNWELDSGAIFRPCLGPKVSRNVFRVSAYAL